MVFKKVLLPRTCKLFGSSWFLKANLIDILSYLQFNLTTQQTDLQPIHLLIARQNMTKFSFCPKKRRMSLYNCCPLTLSKFEFSPYLL